MKTLISFRLRKVLDADLIAAGVNEEQLPDLCRDGLRLMLGLNKTREFEVREKPIAVSTKIKRQVEQPKRPPTEPPMIIQSKSAVWKPESIR
ncbi:hypothetical protein [Paenibacillus naphthalenovorans]|uniref:hypothetical protein n=1 Tax=Paenibacillus naphthalenovorans TaxID=162209 RepID=UPI003D2C8A92